MSGLTPLVGLALPRLESTAIARPVPEPNRPLFATPERYFSGQAQTRLRCPERLPAFSDGPRLVERTVTIHWVGGDNEPPIPERLLHLVAGGKWPRGSFSPATIASIGPREHGLCLLYPPFKTVASLVESGENFWSWPVAAPGELDFHKTVVIGDFGFGSDAPIVLDYREDDTKPCVRRLDYASAATPTGNFRNVSGTHWVLIARTFDEFVDLLRLDEPEQPE